jgi:hypothetical protein
LIVSFTRAAVRDAVGAKLAGNAGEVLRNERPRECGYEGVALLVQSVRAKRWHHKIRGKFVFSVDHNRLNRTAIECPLANVVHVLAALADINGKRDNLFTRRVLQPADTNRRVEATGIR